MPNYGGGGGSRSRRARARPGRTARVGGGVPSNLVYGQPPGAELVPPPGGGVPPSPGVPSPTGGPDYNQLIQGSPAYQAWLASATARRSDLATNRAAAIRQLMLQYGGMPAGFTDAYGDIRPEDAAAEQGNQFSVQKGLERNYKQGVENMHRSLAARGMLESGDLGYGQQQADLVHGQAEHDAAQAFLASLNQIVSGYTGGMGDIGAEESGVIGQILPLIEQLYPGGAPGAALAPAPAGGGGGGAGGGGGGVGSGGANYQAHAVIEMLRRMQHRPAHARRAGGGYQP